MVLWYFSGDTLHFLWPFQKENPVVLFGTNNYYNNSNSSNNNSNSNTDIFRSLNDIVPCLCGSSVSNGTCVFVLYICQLFTPWVLLTNNKTLDLRLYC